jgi:hypothetical protein
VPDNFSVITHPLRSEPLAALRGRSRWLGLALSLLVLWQAAMPWLAAQAAEARGVALVEVCTTYGVRTVALGDGGGEHAPLSSAHSSDHCMLQALGFGPAAALPSHVAPLPAAAIATQGPRTEAPVPDATAQWVARLKHGPPSV